MPKSQSARLYSLSATEMLRRLQSRDITCVDLLEAHLERIAQINPHLNAVIVPLFDSARVAAKAADQSLGRGDNLGPLHGLPISIKEFFDVAGTPTTAGVEGQGATVSEDAPLVARLRRAGAIPIGKTNVPQLGIAIESENPVYGRTNSPWHPARSPGGSSGGEAALIAAGGSPLGLGSDGGGSIRLPSHFCGICGIKPTTRRLTMRGHWEFPAFPPEWSQPGPLARCVDDLELALRCLIAPTGEPADPSIPHGPLLPSSQVDVSELKIGFYSCDSAFPPSPAIRRACREAREILRTKGATVVEFEPPDAWEVWDLHLKLLYADGGKWMEQVLRGSQTDSRISRTLLMARLPTVLRGITRAVFRATGKKTLAQVLQHSSKKSLSAIEYQQVLEQLKAFRRSFSDRLHDEQIDALICPPFASVAQRHGSADIVLAIAYTLTYNVLGMPAGVIPMTTVRTGEESDRNDSRDPTEADLRRADLGSAGLPVGVQVVARHWREDVALAVMRTLEETAASRDGHPSTPVTPSTPGTPVK